MEYNMTVLQCTLLKLNIIILLYYMKYRDIRYYTITHIFVNNKNHAPELIELYVFDSGPLKVNMKLIKDTISCSPIPAI